MNAESVVSVVEPRQVRKRDEVTVQAFDRGKIAAAVRAAWCAVDVERVVEEKIADVTFDTVAALVGLGEVGVEQVQDAVEVSLMRHRLFDVAKAYILYRQKRTEARTARKHPDPEAVSSYIHAAKYARYRRDLQRREVHVETADRVEDMHQRKFAHVPEMAEDIRWAFDQVREERVLPSMRSMQFGGRAIEVNNNRMYNCAFSFVDRPEVFAQTFFLLLSGCGVGYSVQFDHVDRLPALGRVDPRRVVHHTVADNIEGWADALNALVASFAVEASPYYGKYVEFNYALVRDEGVELVTSGGKAPGHLPLKKTIEAVRAILQAAQGRQLRPIECHDIQCHAASAVLSGGIRRSAMIALFSLNDSEMLYAKTGDWYPRWPWRENANNSVMLKRDEVQYKDFKRVFKMTREWGEPGFYFCAHYDIGANPCVEIGLDPRLRVTESVWAKIARKVGEAAAKLYEIGRTYTGWAFCNLCEMNAAMFETAKDFFRAAKAATIIGTCQATYTHFPYLGPVSECIAEREALLGIGMTGILDSPTVALDPALQRAVVAECAELNRVLAARLGIEPAARLTCVKPAGTTSLKLHSKYGPVANGHGPHHARRYIRRVLANELERPFRYFRDVNPHMCVRKPNGDWVIEWPVEAPPQALLKGDFTAVEFLKLVKSTQENWVLPGTARPDSSPGLTHNVSNTCVVQAHEWDDVADYLWENREFFTGVSLLAATGDKDYPFAPQEAVVTEADEMHWNMLVAKYRPVDYTQMIEDDDATDLLGALACTTDRCEFPAR